MNLHALVAGAVAAINPVVPVTVLRSLGYTTEKDGDGTRVPVYVEETGVVAQIQALAWGDLQKLEGLNLEGEKRKIYLNGRYDGVSRSRGVGGDLVIYPDGETWPYGTTWLVAQVLEQWPDWCCVAVTQQLPGGVPADARILTGDGALLTDADGGVLVS